MSKIKFITAAALAAITSISAFAADKLEVLSVAASSSPHAEILYHVVPKLKEQGVDLQVKEFTDYIQPNIVTFEKQVDINFFQHIPYLDAFNKDHGYNLVKSFPIIITPIGVYSTKYKKPLDVKEGGRVAIPNDPTNLARALLVVQSVGLIKLKDPTSIKQSVRDIVDNPKKLKFVEVEAPSLPRVLPDVDLALINTNFAVKAGLDPTKDTIAIEANDSPYANWVVTRPDNANREAVQKLKDAIYKKEVYDWILEKYKGAVLPVFVPTDAPELAPAAKDVALPPQEPGKTNK